MPDSMRLEISKPVPGFYRRRLVKDGPYVAVLICRHCPIDDDGFAIDRHDARRFDAWPPLLCLVDGRERDVIDQWPFLRPISRAEYLYLTESTAWDRAYDPSAPAANPTQPIDINRTAPVF